MKRTQTAVILDLLQSGRTVTKLTVLPLFIGNLHDVILRLRRAGHDILTVTQRDPLGNRYVQYKLSAQ